MDKKILAHAKFVRTEISRIGRLNSLDPERRISAKKLAKFNAEMTRNFQHERQIHLFITLFFAILTLASWILFAIIFANFSGTFFANSGEIFLNSETILVIFASGILALILTILEICYIAYYYKLENRTEKLYELSRKIYEL